MYGIEAIKLMNEAAAIAAELELQVRKLENDLVFLRKAIEDIHENLCPGQGGTIEEKVIRVVKESRDIAFVLRCERNEKEFWKNAW